MKKANETVGTAQNLLSFGDAMQAMKMGKLAYRIGWNGAGLFVFKQVPSQVDLEIVPKMTSLPEAVKKQFLERHKNGVSFSEHWDIDPVELNSIRYFNQFVIVYPNNDIFGWSPSPSDISSDDWVVID